MKNDNVPQTGEPADAQALCQATPSNRILVVDEDMDLRLLSADVLVCSGYQVDTAADGWEALHANRYDLLTGDDWSRFKPANFGGNTGRKMHIWKSKWKTRS